MTDADERNNWERFKNRRMNQFPRPTYYNMSCYEVFDSFDEFVLNGRPYSLNNCPLPIPQSEPEPQGNTEMCDCPRPKREAEVEVQNSGNSPIHPLTEAAIQGDLLGTGFKGWHGVRGAIEMQIMRDANLPYRWTKP